MKPLEFSDIVEMHVKEFGVEPVFTGINAFKSQFEIMELILNAIDIGKPYVEKEVPEGVLI